MNQLNLGKLPPRKLGIIPLSLFAMMVIIYIAQGTPIQAFWVCHFANFLLGIGILFRSRVITTSACLWIFWWGLFYVIEAWVNGTTAYSIISHIGGLSVAIFCAYRSSPVRLGWAWAYVSCGIYQLVVGYFDNTEFNVNLMQRIPEHIALLPTIFKEYWQFYLFLATLDLIGLTTIYSLWILTQRKLKRS